MENKFALIIAVESYLDNKISPVVYAQNDATELSIVLESIGYTKENQIILINEDATKTIIESKMRELIRRATIDDTVLIFYAGHGFEGNGVNYITAHDSLTGDLLNTSIPIQPLYNELRECKSNKIILLFDSCHSGMPLDESMRAILATMTNEELRDFLSESEYNVAFASCKSDESSFPSRDLKHGIWTYHLLEALRGNEPGALERDFYLTASSLQNYLSLEVPRTMRRTYSGSKTQSPVFFGNSSREFLIADLQKIIEARNVHKDFDIQQVTSMLFASTEIRSVKFLSGFKKHHRVPTEANSYTNNFIHNISDDEIKNELDTIFQQLRKNLKYKRRDVEFSVEDGSGSLDTKDFDYSIDINLNEEDPSEIMIQRQLHNIRNPGVIFSENLNDVFNDTFKLIEINFSELIDIGELIDRLEDDDPKNIEFDYPLDRQNVQIKFDKIPFKIEVQSRKLLIRLEEMTSPKSLVEGYLETMIPIQSADSLKLLPLPS